MFWDGGTDYGAIYSTNHFFNNIYDEREDFELNDIDSLRKLDATISGGIDYSLAKFPFKKKTSIK
jgi:hypothetical protein